MWNEFFYYLRVQISEKMCFMFFLIYKNISRMSTTYIFVCQTIKQMKWIPIEFLNDLYLPFPYCKILNLYCYSEVFLFLFLIQMYNFCKCIFVPKISYWFVNVINLLKIVMLIFFTIIFFLIYDLKNEKTQIFLIKMFNISLFW